MNFDQALARACEQPTLLKALSFIAVWEADRAVHQAFRWKETGQSTAAHDGGWDTCFERCFAAVLERWAIRRDDATPAGGEDRSG